MFTVITPDLRVHYRTILSEVFKTREGYYSPKLTKEMIQDDTPSTIYIAYVDPEHGTFGSCRLNSLTHSPASSFYKKTFKPDVLREMKEVSLISFHMEEGHPSQEAKGAFNVAIQRFYWGLYDFLVSLSMEKRYRGYVTLMDAEEHGDLPLFGEWRFDECKTVTLDGCPLTAGFICLGPSVAHHLRSQDRIYVA